MSLVLFPLGFQFHKGTIRTILRSLPFQHFNKFQFHKGTIRTICGMPLVPSSRDFNSIKVRLERSSIPHDDGELMNFNSIKVRLERLVLPCTCQCHEFQFHKGTIRTSIKASPASLRDSISIP